MPTNLTLKAEEESTYIIRVVFKDEDGNSVVPNNVHWKLTDSEGTVINGRSDETEIAASSIDITLHGDDLAVVSAKGSNKLRILTIWGTYDSDLVTNSPYKDACRFFVKDLVAIT